MPNSLPEPCPSPTFSAASDPRRDLLETGGAETARAKRYGRPLGLLMLEIRGDEALGATVLETVVRSGIDRVLRLEPARSVVLLPETTLSGTMHAGARLQGGLSACGVRSRIGFAALDKEDAGFLDMLRRAQAMLER